MQPWPAAEPYLPQPGSARISQKVISGMTGQANAWGHLAIGSLGPGQLSWEEDVGKENSPFPGHQAHVGATSIQSISPPQQLAGDEQQVVPITVMGIPSLLCPTAPSPSWVVST